MLDTRMHKHILIQYIYVFYFKFFNISYTLFFQLQKTNYILYTTCSYAYIGKIDLPASIFRFNENGYHRTGDVNLTFRLALAR